MNILYITNDGNIIDCNEARENNTYIISIDKNVVINNNYKLTRINIKDIQSEEIHLGVEFLIGYKIMTTVKDSIYKYDIDRIVLSCKYIDAYFTMQYLVYGGDDIKSLEIYNQQCDFTELLGNVYKFPYYWIRELENKCRRMLDHYHKINNVAALPKLSIIIPYYNLGKYINETIESIRSSSYKNCEIIIVNDGTTDLESQNILNELRKQNDIYIIDQENAGLSVARNVGVMQASGEYITFLDADDLVEKDYYTRAVNVLKNHSDVDIVYSWVRYFESKNEIWPTFDLSMPYLLLSNMTAAFYVIRKEQFVKYGINKQDMRKGMEDYDSLISMHSNGCKGVSIPEPLVKYRYRLGSMSKSFNPQLIAEIYNNIIDNHEETYKKYSIEIMKIINCNGPGYLWNNPTFNYPSVCLNSNEDINDIKYTLIRLMNTKLGKFIIRILKFYKGKKNR